MPAAASFLQIQTRAAHRPRSPASRPTSKPVQPTPGGYLSYSSSSTSSSASTSSAASTSDSASSRSSGSSSPRQSAELDAAHFTTMPARCSRCQRSVTTDAAAPGAPGVQFGVNLYYCRRCAKMVGYER